MKNKGKILLAAVLGGALMSGCGGNVSSSESIDGGGTASSTESSTPTSTSESSSEDLTEELSDSTKLKERLLLAADRVVTSRRLSTDLSGTIYDDGKTESVSLATEHEGLRTYTETPTGGATRTYVSYTGIPPTSATPASSAATTTTSIRTHTAILFGIKSAKAGSTTRKAPRRPSSSCTRRPV